MIIPTTKDAAASPAGPQPTEAQMLMALAMQHQQERFDVAMDTSQMRRSTNVIDKTGDPSGREEVEKEDQEENQREAEIIQAAEEQSRIARRNRPLIGPAVATHGIRPSNLGIGK